MNPSREQLRQLDRDNRKYSDHLVGVPKSQWPPFPQGRSTAEICWRSRKFMVVLWREQNGYLRLSVNRTEWDKTKKRFRDDVSWDDLQRLKKEAGFGNWSAVECYPADDKVVNVANMRHLFLLAETPEYFW